MSAPGHVHDLTPFRHSHAFGDAGEARRGHALLAVTLITLVTMAVELAAGWWTGSLALTADGWHMGTHAAALGGAVLAMRWSQRARQHEGYAFGGWKIEVLAGYTSALALAAVAVGLAVEAVRKLVSPEPIAFGEAMAVAVLGLGVNLASAWLLARSGHLHDHHHDDGHDHHHGHAHRHHDHNFRAAYVHVLADALTSVLAIAALAGGWWLGWRWLDPAVALLGAAVIGQWSFGLVKQTARALVDATADERLRQAVRAAIENDGDAKLADLHVWQVGPEAYAVLASVVADRPLAPADYQARLAPLKLLRHVTVEVHRCTGSPPHAHAAPAPAR